MTMKPSEVAGFAILASLACFLYLYLRKRLLDFLWREGTVLHELSHLGEQRPQGEKIRETAVIAGCGLAGLIAARVCADHFEEVVLVDPEQSWESANVKGKEDKRSEGEVWAYGVVDGVPVSKKRSRVAQYLATHSHQTISLLVYRKCFPDWDQQYTDAGGIITPFACTLSYSGLTAVKFDKSYIPPELHYSPRPTLETLLRHNVRKYCTNVSFVTGSVVGINRDVTDSMKVSSVNIKLQGEDNIQIMDSTLVIECAGPLKAGLKWLGEAGFGTGSMRTLDEGKLPIDKIALSYSSRSKYTGNTYFVTPELAEELNAVIPGGYYNRSDFLVFLPQPPLVTRGLGFGRIGRDQVSIFRTNWGECTLSNSEDEWKEYMRTWKGIRPFPDWMYQVVDILFKETPIAVVQYRDPPCTKLQYERAANLPSNFIALGDACTRFNPVFGQGTSQGVMGACILDDLLRNIPGGNSLPLNFSETYFARHAKKISDPIWTTTQTMDYGFATTIPSQGESLSKGAWIRWYSDQLLQACSWSSEARRAHNDVWMFVSPPITLFSPRVLGVVLYQWFTGRVGV